MGTVGETRKRLEADTSNIIGKSSWKQLSGCLVCLLTIAAIPVVSSLFLLLYLRSTSVGYVKVSGRVIDALGEPVPDSRVVMTTLPRSLKGGGHSQFGVMADSKGRFQLEAELPFPAIEIFVEASSPSNSYALATVSDIYDPGELLLQVLPLDADKRNKEQMKYEHFTGELRPSHKSSDVDFTFVGKAWDIQTGRRSK